MTLKFNRTARCALAVSLCWTFAGCGEAPSSRVVEPSTVSVAATAPGSPLPNTPAPLTLATHEQPNNALEIAPVAPATGELAPAPASDYQPPFPDRVDLFVAPKREGGAHAAGDVGSVALLGFVEVDQPQAVLSINGEVTPIAAGEVENGVEVISIQPPMVLLQRGRQRWQATLEN